MLETELSFWPELSEAERLHFRHLAMVRPQLPSEGQVHMLEGLARSLASPRLSTAPAAPCPRLPYAARHARSDPLVDVAAYSV